MQVNWTHGREVYREPRSRSMTWVVGLGLATLSGVLLALASLPNRDAHLVMLRLMIMGYGVPAAVWVAGYLHARRVVVDFDGVQDGQVGGGRWAHLAHVEHLPLGGLVLHFADGRRRSSVRLAPPLRDWGRLVAKLTAAFGEQLPPPPAEQTALPAARIEAWLGVAPAGSLRLHSPLAGFGLLGGAFLGLGAVMLAGVAAALLLSAWVHPLWLGLGFVALLAGLYRWLAGRLRRLSDGSGAALVANGHGLRVHDDTGEHWAAWGSLVDLERRDLRWIVSTTTDSFVLDHELPGAEVVLETVQQVLAARAQGQVAVDDADVPETAISRALGPESSAERGLSVSGNHDA